MQDLPTPPMTELLPTDTPEHLRSAVTRAVKVLSAGDVVALPTETVYGLAADATREEALTRIFAAKGRPTTDPLIIHLPTRQSLHDYAEVPDEIYESVDLITRRLWPGPLTLVLPKRSIIPDLATAGLPSIAVRMSSNRVFKQVVKAFGKPLAAPSANRFGRVSATSATAVMDELDGRIPLVLDDGGSHFGLESTIVRIETGKKPGKPDLHVLRPGCLTKEDLRPYGRVLFDHTSQQLNKEEAAESPGTLESHYAPTTPLRLLDEPGDFQPVPGKTYALISYRGQEADGFLNLHEWQQVVILSPGSGKLPEAAVRFYFALRKADASGADEIISEPIPDRGLGTTMIDRLRRAAAASSR